MTVLLLNGWRAVDAVLRNGTVAGAADELGVTTAAIGAQLRSVEQRIGRPLFDRQPGGLRPTPELMAVADRIASGFATLSSVQNELTAHTDPRRLSLTVTQTFAESWLPRHLPSFFAQMGNVDLRMDTRWEVVDLSEGDFDFAIRYMGDPGPELGSAALLPSGVVQVCTPDFARRYDLKQDRPSLKNAPIVKISVPTSDPDWCDWDEWCKRTGVPGPGGTFSQSFTLTGSGLRIAQLGTGLVLGGLSETFNALADGRLIMPFGTGSVVKGAYWHRLVWPKNRRLGKLQRSFRDWAIDRAAQDRAVMKRVFDL